MAGLLAEYLIRGKPRAWAERITFYADHREAVDERAAAISQAYVPITWEDTAESVRSEIAVMIAGCDRGTAAQDVSLFPTALASDT